MGSGATEEAQVGNITVLPEGFATCENATHSRMSCEGRVSGDLLVHIRDDEEEGRWAHCVRTAPSCASEEH